ncbi:GNAT family N-acetyltransferase [uncultured Friedmanniella sp.]|uniref:GNAT family N-acetyltransferase n=1 Tax=uncultured Friedmanniella sp. TaxID=335381 RepID=UPI0035CC154D
MGDLHEPWLILEATPDDAEEYVACHVDCLAETYVDIMPPAFAQLHRAEAPEKVRRLRREWRDGTLDSSWLARDAAGEVVGIVQSGPGVQDWEAALDAPPTTVPHQLNHLYTRRRTFGTGLGRQLLEAALPDEATYLWILHDNARADAFYRRHGFVANGDEMNCGPSWFHRTMYRMVRPGLPAGTTPQPRPRSVA